MQLTRLEQFKLGFAAILVVVALASLGNRLYSQRPASVANQPILQVKGTKSQYVEQYQTPKQSLRSDQVFLYLAIALGIGSILILLAVFAISARELHPHMRRPWRYKDWHKK